MKMGMGLLGMDDDDDDDDSSILGMAGKLGKGLGSLFERKMKDKGNQNSN